MVLSLSIYFNYLVLIFGGTGSTNRSTGATTGGLHGGMGGGTPIHTLMRDPTHPIDKRTLENATFDTVVKRIEKLSLYRKMQNPENLQNVTKREVIDLFHVLCPDAARKVRQEIPLEITSDDLLILSSIPNSRLTPDQVKQMAQDCDRDGNGVITIEELYKAITQGTII